MLLRQMLLRELYFPFCRRDGDGRREEAFGKVVDMLLEQRMKAKAAKDWATSDLIRDQLTALGFEIKDTKDGFSWKLNK